MNVSKSSTAVPQAASDALRLAAHGKLETPINNLFFMTSLTMEFFELVSSNMSDDSAELKMSRHEIETLSFGLYNVNGRIKELYDLYYASFGPVQS